MKKLIAVVCLLVACDAPRYGGELLTECLDNVPVTITVHLVDDPAKEYKKYSGRRNDDIQGFGIVRSDNTSELYLPELRGRQDSYRMEVWGHEFAHAICGDWHPADETFFD